MGYLSKKRTLGEIHLAKLTELQNVSNTELYQYNSFSTLGTSLTVKNPIDTERTFELVINSGMYSLLNNIIPDLPYVSDLKVLFLNKITPTNPELFKSLKKENTLIEFFNLFYTNQLSSCVSQEDYELYKNLYDKAVLSTPSKSIFSFRLKDSSGNMYLETEGMVAYHLKDKYAFDFTVPMDDTTDPAKTAFESNDTVFPFLYFEHYDLEIPLLFNQLGNPITISANHLYIYVVDEISVSEDSKALINRNYKNYYIGNGFIY